MDYLKAGNIARLKLNLHYLLSSIIKGSQEK